MCRTQHPLVHSPTLPPTDNARWRRTRACAVRGAAKLPRAGQNQAIQSRSFQRRRAPPLGVLAARRSLLSAVGKNCCTYHRPLCVVFSVVKKSRCWKSATGVILGAVAGPAGSRCAPGTCRLYCRHGNTTAIWRFCPLVKNHSVHRRLVRITCHVTCTMSSSVPYDPYIPNQTTDEQSNSRTAAIQAVC